MTRVRHQAYGFKSLLALKFLALTCFLGVAAAAIQEGLDEEALLKRFMSSKTRSLSAPLPSFEQNTSSSSSFPATPSFSHHYPPSQKPLFGSARLALPIHKRTLMARISSQHQFGTTQPIQISPPLLISERKVLSPRYPVWVSVNNGNASQIAIKETRFVTKNTKRCVAVMLQEARADVKPLLAAPSPKVRITPTPCTLVMPSMQVAASKKSASTQPLTPFFIATKLGPIDGLTAPLYIQGTSYKPELNVAINAHIHGADQLPTFPIHYSPYQCDYAPRMMPTTILVSHSNFNAHLAPHSQETDFPQTVHEVFPTPSYQDYLYYRSYPLFHVSPAFISCKPLELILPKQSKRFAYNSPAILENLQARPTSYRSTHPTFAGTPLALHVGQLSLALTSQTFNMNPQCEISPLALCLPEPSYISCHSARIAHHPLDLEEILCPATKHLDGAPLAHLTPKRSTFSSLPPYNVQTALASYEDPAENRFTLMPNESSHRLSLAHIAMPPRHIPLQHETVEVNVTLMAYVPSSAVHLDTITPLANIAQVSEPKQAGAHSNASSVADHRWVAINADPTTAFELPEMPALGIALINYEIEHAHVAVAAPFATLLPDLSGLTPPALLGDTQPSYEVPILANNFSTGANILHPNAQAMAPCLVAEALQTHIEGMPYQDYPVMFAYPHYGADEMIPMQHEMSLPLVPIAHLPLYNTPQVALSEYEWSTSEARFSPSLTQAGQIISQHNSDILKTHEELEPFLLFYDTSLVLSRKYHSGMYHKRQDLMAHLEGILDYENISLANHYNCDVNYTYNSDEELYDFEILLSPRPRQSYPEMAQNFIFVIDSSAMIDRKRYAGFKKGVIKSLDYLKPSDTVAVLMVDKDISSFMTSSQRLSPSVKHQLVKDIASLKYSGYYPKYELADMMCEAETFFMPGRENVVILLSDAHTFANMRSAHRFMRQFSEQQSGAFSVYTATCKSQENLSQMRIIAELHQGSLCYSPTIAAFPRNLAILVKHATGAISSNIEISLEDSADNETTLYPTMLSSTLFGDTPFKLYGSTKELENFSIDIKAHAKHALISLPLYIDFDRAYQSDRLLPRQMQEQRAISSLHQSFFDDDPAFFKSLEMIVDLNEPSSTLAAQ